MGIERESGGERGMGKVRAGEGIEGISNARFREGVREQEKEGRRGRTANKIFHGTLKKKKNCSEP